MKLILVFALCLPFICFAQVNESDTVKIKADVSLTGLYQSGNVQTVIFRANSNLAVRPWKKWVYKTKNSYVYQEFGKSKADEDVLSLNFLYFNPDRRLYPQVLGFFSTNFRRKIDQRYLVGGGLTYQVWQEKHNWLKLSLTSEYEHTDFDALTFNKSEYNGSSTINTMRATLWVNGKHYLFNKKVILGHESYVQPSLKYSNNFRWQTDLSLELPLWKYINFKVNYLHTVESIVIEGQQQEDSVLSFGFTIKSY